LADKHHQQQTNKQQLLPNQILTGATNATVQDWQQFPNWVTEAGATLMGVVLTTIIIIILALNQRLL
jgi:hypothetical protein